jgi:hypothetical protein
VPLPSPTANGVRLPSFEVSLSGLTIVTVQHKAQHVDPSSLSFWQLHLLVGEQSHAGVGVGIGAGVDVGSGGNCAPRISLQHPEQVQPMTSRFAQVSFP